jgi:ATP-dependent RNA helicase DDX55/SPB4
MALMRFFSRVFFAVLDEADQLLNHDMSASITAILGKLPKQRRTGLFSATQTKEVKALARAGLRNPAVVSVAVQHVTGSDGSVSLSAGALGGVPTSHQSTPTALTNYVQICSTPLAKLAALCRFLDQRATAGEKVIVFVLTCASVDFYGNVFSLADIRSAAGLPSTEVFPILPLHGKMAPKKRTSVYSTFVAARSGALLCTDVAARGIDIPDVDWIVQFDPPKDPAFFIHRVGRTARAGRSGSSLLLLLPKEQTYLQLLAIKNVPIVAWSGLTPLSVASSEPSSAGDLESLPVFDDEETVGPPTCRAMQAAALADRNVLEKGTTAFVAFVRG